MLLEDILLAVAIGGVALVFGLPLVRFLKGTSWRTRDPLAEAQERLRIAKRDAEAARLNREAEKIYERMYDEPRDDPRDETPDDTASAREDDGSEGKRNG